MSFPDKQFLITELLIITQTSKLYQVKDNDLLYKE